MFGSFSFTVFFHFIKATDSISKNNEFSALNYWKNSFIFEPIKIYYSLNFGLYDAQWLKSIYRISLEMSRRALIELSDAKSIVFKIHKTLSIKICHVVIPISGKTETAMSSSVYRDRAHRYLFTRISHECAIVTFASDR